MPSIRVLPDTVVNQIAAGEVVERPASVVKELVENSLDAGAHRVTVRLGDGGRDLVEVEDDGSGMDSDDALLALERHATSKVAAASDLEDLATLGFRGEALPSIAAVCLLELETAPADGPGHRVTVEFGRIRDVAPCTRPRGTRVNVRDLFARLPARRKFLRTGATELRHILATLTGLAFTHPETTFLVKQGNRTLLELPAVPDQARRLPDLVGADRARQATPVRRRAGELSLDGFLVPGRGTSDVILAVNGRVVKDRLLTGAANRALRDAGGGRPDDLFLALTLPVDRVDVNVHPTKAEVRFADPGRIFSAVTEAIAAARADTLGPTPIRRVVVPDHPRRRWPPSSQLPFDPPTWSQPRAADHPTDAAPSAFSGETVPSPPPVATGAAGSTHTHPWGRYLGQFRETYLLLEQENDLLLVDQHVAHERVLFERLLDQPGTGIAQPMLLPEVVELNPAQSAMVEELAHELAAIGLEVEPASGSTVRVLATPAALPPLPAAAMLAQLLADLTARTLPGDTARERLAAGLACQAAVKKSRPLDRREAEALLADLARCRDPHRCPHGRPIALSLPLTEIERRIGRR